MRCFWISTGTESPALSMISCTLGRRLASAWRADDVENFSEYPASMAASLRVLACMSALAKRDWRSVGRFFASRLFAAADLRGFLSLSLLIALLILGLF